MQPDDIVEVARSYLGVRFRHQGRCRERGLDCLGLLVCVSRDLGLVWPSALLAKLAECDYSHTPDELYLRTSIEMFLCPCGDEPITNGDVVLMQVQGRVQHLGVLATHPHYQTRSLIHAYAPVRKVVEHQLDAQWERAIVNRYRLPCIAG